MFGFYPTHKMLAWEEFKRNIMKENINALVYTDEIII